MTETSPLPAARGVSDPATAEAPAGPGSPADPLAVGLVDGAQPVTTSRFHVVLAEHAAVELDDLIETGQLLPDGTELIHYGIVVEGRGIIEGAELSSDTRRITGDKTMPGATSRTVEVQVLRTVPERWLAPEPGAVVRLARDTAAGDARSAALFLDQMDAPLPVGVDQAGQPVYADFAFLSRLVGSRHERWRSHQ